MRTAEEFRAHAKAHKIERWDTHPCSICGAYIGYVFEQGGQERVGFDSWCDCSAYASPYQLRDWNDVAAYYNMQISPRYIAEMDAFWHFDTAIAKATEVQP